ncbi:hypothetical protein [Marinactinospora rubrisoli]|uniref:Uncharacterized protein n=1 Tax=Marinactinospora rubrisoli TaxID=2715399 RepID=A0ABW2KKF0_9ACTN
MRATVKIAVIAAVALGLLGPGTGIATADTFGQCGEPGISRNVC